jgi:hypothetical protein
MMVTSTQSKCNLVHFVKKINPFFHGQILNNPSHWQQSPLTFLEYDDHFDAEVKQVDQYQRFLSLSVGVFLVGCLQLLVLCMLSSTNYCLYIKVELICTFSGLQSVVSTSILFY